MSYVLLILAAGGIGFLGYKQFLKNLKEVQTRNSGITNPFTKGWNYFTGLLWASYIIIFAGGLIVNNLILN